MHNVLFLKLTIYFSNISSSLLLPALSINVSHIIPSTLFNISKVFCVSSFDVEFKPGVSINVIFLSISLGAYIVRYLMSLFIFSL